MSVESVRAKLDSDAELFEIRDEGQYIVAQPKHYLPSEVFARVAKKVKDAHGEYVSSGKMSHFRFQAGVYPKDHVFENKEESGVERRTANKPTQDKKANLYKDIFAYADDVEKRGEAIIKQAQIIKEKLKELQK